jgi:hypothetical protein
MLAVLTTILLPAANPAVEVTLRGSPESMERQRAVSDRLGLPAARTVAEMEELARRGLLVDVPGAPTYEVASWVFPYAIPEVRRFVEDLAREHVSACGEPLVVTSLTRPLDQQPPNAHDLSVHPSGMAADLRIPRDSSCRAWLEATLLDLERRGVVDATRERAPPHYHVAVFPREYAHLAARRDEAEARSAAAGARRDGARGRTRAGAAGELARVPVLLAAAALIGVLLVAVFRNRGASRG